LGRTKITRFNFPISRFVYTGRRNVRDISSKELNEYLNHSIKGMRETGIIKDSDKISTKINSFSFTIIRYRKS
jgi:hypothetical protein